MSNKVAKKVRKVARKHVERYFKEIASWSWRERIRMAWRIIFIKKRRDDNV